MHPVTAQVAQAFPRRSIEEPDLKQIIKSELFRNVGSNVLERVREFCHVIKVEAGDTLLESGQPNDRMYVVIKGELRVYLDDNRQNHYVSVVGGECVGELSIIDGRGASALVVTCSGCELVEIDQDTLWSLVQNCPHIARNLLLIMSNKVRHDNSTITSAMQRQLHLEQIANIDGLTGIHNRRWLDNVFPRVVERCHMTEDDDSTLSLIVIDIDYFKQYNDLYGHLVGDRVLCNVAKTLAKNLRPSDMLARYGGEEFAILMLDTDITSAVLVANRIRKAVAESQLDHVDGTVLAGITISAGVAALKKEENLPSFLERADKALYEAKQAGRNRVKIAAL